jgi:biotin synthase
LKNIVSVLGEKVLDGEALTQAMAGRLGEMKGPEAIFELIYWANKIRQKFKGETIDLCAIVNAKSGRCSEDCAFCAQSSWYPTEAPNYPLLETAELLDSAHKAFENKAGRFGIVTSGRSLSSPKELDRVCRVISVLSAEGQISPCASLGLLIPDMAKALKRSGLTSYHHNIETAPSFYPSICTTHSFEARSKTIQVAKEEGFRICSGGIFGLGETMEQRLEMAFTLRELGVNSIPMNFLNAIPGTPLEGLPSLPPLELLKLIALFRFILPQADIRTCGGREKGLRTLQALMYMAGCNGTMIGNYLTTEGRNPKVDIQEIRDLGLVPSVECESKKTHQAR